MEPFVPPPYPHDRLAPLRDLAAAVPGGMVDLSIGDPCDPMPETVVRALDAAVAAGVRYPPTIGTPRLREAASGWMHRRLGVDVDPSAVMACIGTKELVASLPHHLRLRDPSRDTVLYPSVAYPTYAMGAVLAGCRAVPVPLDADWRLDLTTVSDADAERALLLWVNAPANPTGSVVDIDWMDEVARWARDRGIVVASDECYVEFVFDADGSPAPVGDRRRASILHAGSHGVLAVHSLSKRSNMAGMRAGFVAGDPELVRYLGEVRKHSGLMVPGPVQAAAAAAVDDDAHAEVQLRRYADRRTQFGAWVAASGLVDESGPGTFYLWLRDPSGADGWDLTRRLAAAGTLVSPGELYGEAGSHHVRIALVAPHDRLALAIERQAERFQPGVRPGGTVALIRGPFPDGVRWEPDAARFVRRYPTVPVDAALAPLITRLWEAGDDLESVLPRAEARDAVFEAVGLLDRGEARVAEVIDDEVVVHAWAKQAVLLLFRFTEMATTELGPFEYRDKIPLKHDYAAAGVRVVPGASARFGSYLAPGVVMMPSYVNIGAYVDSGSMVDTWATVGSCAQIGRNVHLSGGVGIGGVLEPPQAAPVVIEDDAFIGSRSIVVEGARVGRGAKLGAGVIITASTPVIDAQSGEELARGVVPARAVAIAATRDKKFPGGSFGLPCVLVLRTLAEGEEHDKLQLNAILREHGVAT